MMKDSPSSEIQAGERQALRYGMMRFRRARLQRSMNRSAAAEMSQKCYERLLV